ncbi:hypothetical protein PVAP13_9KG611300 [Panicum virgatum]|uniref:Uncharacterized protein n=1 Tax=Panicum virgatum TaxID=38727 RepID=A0A8T0NXP8_PANVG|nr:hypothetical protein PVAP13_9KG611300 [Panicum virgatum]
MAGCLWPCVTGVVPGSGAGRVKGGLFRSKPRTPPEVVQHVVELVTYILDHKQLHEGSAGGGKRDTKLEHRMTELTKSIKEMKVILYGNGEEDPCDEACKQLTKEFFKKNVDIFRQLVVCLPHLDLETQKDVTQVIANLQRQKVDSRLVASEYLEANSDLLDILMSRYVLESQHFRSFFDYIQFPDFNVQSDVFKTFKELMTRHKSTVAEFFSKNYDWLLRDILLERSNAAVMARYVSSKDHLIILMNLLRDQSKAIQVEAFHVFKLFVVNKEKPSEITCILHANRNKLLRFLKDFSAVDKDDKKFEADKARVISEILTLAMKSSS